MIAPAAPVTESAADPIDRLLRLLPPILQLDDAYAGQPLRALLRVMAEQADWVEGDIAGLLENWFVETCDEWVLPYLGELVGYRPSPTTRSPAIGRYGANPNAPRREVADTVRHRRRKGTLLVLEEIARTAAGWPARAVEFGPLMVAAAHARFPDVPRGPSPDAHAGDLIELGFGPFGTVVRRPDARRMASARTPGGGGAASVALYVWRLLARPVQFGQACRICPDPDPGSPPPYYYRFTCDPFGEDRQLFTSPREPAPAAVQSAGELDVPGPIRRRAFRDRPADYYGHTRSIAVWLNFPLRDGRLAGKDWAIPLQRIVPARLDRWEATPGLADRLPNQAVAIDPELGRLLLRWDHRRDGPPPTAWIRYLTAFAAEIGSGGYPRTFWPAPTVAAAGESADGGPRDSVWHVARKAQDDQQNRIYSSFAKALDAWDAAEAAGLRTVVIEIDDDANHDLGPSAQTIRKTRIYDGERLIVRAASGRRPVIKSRREGCETYRVWRIESRGPHPARRAGRTDSGTASSAAERPTFGLDGIRLGGPPPEMEHSRAQFRGLELRVVGAFRQVRLRHTTLVPSRARLVLERFRGCASVEQCVLGAVTVDASSPRAGGEPGTPPDLYICDSILDGGGREAAALAAGGKAGPATAAFIRLTAARVTAFGPVRVYALAAAQDSIFGGGLEVTRTEFGCVRFCSLTLDNVVRETTPQRYECQPDLELQRQGLIPVTPANAKVAALVAARVAPRFTPRPRGASAAVPSTAPPYAHYGDPGYAQLALTCPKEVKTGAEDGSEMGVFHDLYEPQRTALLSERLVEYTPAGSDARLIFVT
jgi:hypothetical protein